MSNERPEWGPGIVELMTKALRAIGNIPLPSGFEWDLRVVRSTATEPVQIDIAIAGGALRCCPRCPAAEFHSHEITEAAKTDPTIRVVCVGCGLNYWPGTPEDLRVAALRDKA